MGLISTQGNIPKRTFLFVKSEYKLIRVDLENILYFSGMRDYTKIYFIGKTNPLTTLQNLKDFETKLPSSEFIRVHRSYIVAIKHIDFIIRNEINIANTIIPIGNAFKKGFEDIIIKNA